MDEVRFARGLGYAEYLASTENNREEFTARYAEVTLRREDVEFFEALVRERGPLKVLALAEDWCPDVVNNLPVVARIAESAPGIELRVFPRDENLDVMDQYLNQGQFRSIPTIVFFDARFAEIGRWIERPAAANRLLAELRAEQGRLQVPDDQARQERRRRMAQAYREQLTQETVREIKEALS